MVHREGSHGGKEYILERFESIDEFLKEVGSRETSPQYNGEPTARNIRDNNYSDSRWRGAKGYNEAREQFVNGTKAKAAMLKAYQTEVDPRQRQAINAPCGCAPIVAHALMGIPDSMIDIRRKRIPKATKVIVDMTVSSYVNAGDITEAGKKIIAAVGKLEGEGISTEITCTVDSLLNGRQLTGMGVTVKNAGQAFNAARVSFPMSSPAFLRVFSFLQTSTLPKALFDWGYGVPVATHYENKELAEYYRTMYGDGIYLSLAKVVSRGQEEINRAIEAWRKGR
jgi:hypothetical protein